MLFLLLNTSSKIKLTNLKVNSEKIYKHLQNGISYQLIHYTTFHRGHCLKPKIKHNSVMMDGWIERLIIHQSECVSVCLHRLWKEVSLSNRKCWLVSCRVFAHLQNQEFNGPPPPSLTTHDTDKS